MVIFFAAMLEDKIENRFIAHTKNMSGLIKSSNIKRYIDSKVEKGFLDI